MLIGVWYIAEGDADFGMLTDFDTDGNPALAILAGVALSFFAMTGFENTANVAEETIDPHKSFPRSLIGGMIIAGVIYVLVSMSAALTVADRRRWPSSDAALLEVVKAGILPLAGRLHDHAVLGDRDDRDHQHHPGRRGHPAADPLRHGQRGRRPRRLRQDPRHPPQPLGRPALQRPRGLRAADGRHGAPEVGAGLDLVARLALVTVSSCSSSTPWSSSPPEAARAGRGRAHLPRQHRRCCSSAWSATSPSSAGRSTTTRRRCSGAPAWSAWASCCSCRVLLRPPDRPGAERGDPAPRPERTRGPAIFARTGPLWLVLLFVDILGFAALLGGMLVQMRLGREGGERADARRRRHRVPGGPGAGGGARGRRRRRQPHQDRGSSSASAWSS